MFKHYFEQIHNVEIWPIISLIIFFAFFTAVLFRVYFMDKDYIDKMKDLPFENDQDGSKTNLKI
jgi:cytochrome c oxidase cbb3-type subunit IV